ncbi:MAG: hypothetical protein HY730_05690 [Candidatus Tectomicrobia bacterium]|uniref:RepB-like DNA primase domain-containing protein n=1 Tax=Tectimicrobiota bacterium TaxID=2528274 RepID=A0A933GLY4_UNCTE|nr:hypothetical protein [Candidatus Tectomicrobia bacterium]
MTTREGGGKKEHIVQIPALWADLDFKDFPQEEFDRRLKSFPLSPSIIVRSGGGYHCYWLLKEPLERADIAQVEDYLKRLAAYLGGDQGFTDAAQLSDKPSTKKSTILNNEG